MMKKALKVLLVAVTILTIAGFSATTVLASTTCVAQTNSGTNRSGLCGNLSRGTRRGRVNFNHSQFNINSSISSVSRGTESSVTVQAEASSGLGSRMVAARHQQTGSVSVTRIAFQRPHTWAIIGQ